MKRLVDADKLQKLFNATSSALLSDVELSKDIEHVVRACLMVAEMISDAPTVDAEPIRHGFIRMDKGYNECSICGYNLNGDSNYCPHCGAKMDEVKDG